MLDASGDLADSLVETDSSGNIIADVTGDLTGNADTVTTNANLTGDVTSIGNATTIAPASLDNAMINTAEITAAGSVAGLSSVLFTLNAYAFFPMIHSVGGAAVRLITHTTDGASSDAPRFGIVNVNSSPAYAYDMDYRYIQA